MRKQAGFTLLETVIALGVAVVMLGASVSARQYLLRNAQISEQQTIMNSLVDDAASKIELARAAHPNNFGLNFIPIVGIGSSAVDVLPVANSGSSSSINELDWCTISTLSTCPTLTTTVTTTSGTGTMTDLTSNSNAEVIAVSTQVPGAAQAGKYQVIDRASYATVQTTKIKAGSAGYTFYNRQIEITAKTDAAAYGDASGKYSYYQVKITVWPYLASKAAGTTRTVIVTDPTGTPFS